MKIGNSENSYGIVSRIFHWLVGGIVLYSMYIAFDLEYAEPENRLEIITNHKALGVIILALTIFRVIWKTCNTTPVIEGNLYHKILGHSMHYILYILIILMGVSGICMSFSYGYGINMWNLFTIPPLLDKNLELANFLKATHELSGNTLIILIFIHICAAIYNHFRRKISIFDRIA